MKKIIKSIIPKPVLLIMLDIIVFVYLKYYQIRYKRFYIRKNSTDLIVFRSIFVYREFKLPISIDPELIIDTGAYTGLSSLYFALKYPQAKIYSIEPEKSNFITLVKNTKNIKNIKPINKGIWHNESHLKIIDRKTGNFGFMVKEVGKNEPFDIDAVTIAQIFNDSKCNKIDILKIDIEGAEKELFTHGDKSWINYVNVIMIELHDKIKEGCTKSFYSAFNLDEWHEIVKGEKVILIRKKLL